MMVKKMINISKKMFGTPKIGEQPKPVAKAVEQLAEDSFEYIAQHEARLASEVEGIEFVSRKIQYAPEDVEKMKNMTHSEKNKYIRQLRKEGKYTYVDETES